MMKSVSTPIVAVAATAAALAVVLPPPSCDALALQSSVPHSPPDPRLSKITIAGGDLQAQSIPLSYASTWPVWMVSPDGSSVTRVPDESFGGGGGGGPGGGEGGWVNPATFEQIWLPMDLPSPTTNPAIGLVLKDGVPRYVFPTMETTLRSKDGGAWHNWGLNSLPLGKTWLPFGDVPVDSLGISCYRRPLPPPEEGDDDGPAGADDADGGNDEADGAWKPVLQLTGVGDVMDTLFNVLALGPDELGSGFCFLIASLPAEKSASAFSSMSGDSVVVPGQRVRAFLSNVENMPTSQDPDDDRAWVWTRGECDVTVHNVAPGGESDFLPDAYRRLYE